MSFLLINKNNIVAYISRKKERFKNMDTIRLGLPIFFSKNVARRAFKVAIIVGIILAFINHGDFIFSGKVTIECWIR